MYISRGIRESPPQFENRIMAQVYVRSITRSTVCTKKLNLLAGAGVWKISSGANYLKRFIIRINEVYVFQ